MAALQDRAQVRIAPFIKQHIHFIDEEGEIEEQDKFIRSIIEKLQ